MNNQVDAGGSGLGAEDTCLQVCLLLQSKLSSCFKVWAIRWDAGSMMPSKSSCVQPAGRGKSCGTAVPGKGPGSGPRRRILFLQGLFKLLETSKYSLVVSDSYQNDMNPREEVGQEVHGHELCSRSSGQEEESWTVEGLHERWVCWHFHVDFVSSQSFINRLNRLSPSLSFIFMHLNFIT